MRPPMTTRADGDIDALLAARRSDHRGKDKMQNL
jgi:hypothetical protein